MTHVNILWMGAWGLKTNKQRRKNTSCIFLQHDENLEILVFLLGAAQMLRFFYQGQGRNVVNTSLAGLQSATNIHWCLHMFFCFNGFEENAKHRQTNDFLGPARITAIIAISNNYGLVFHVSLGDVCVWCRIVHRDPSTNSARFGQTCPLLCFLIPITPLRCPWYSYIYNYWYCDYTYVYMFVYSYVNIENT